MEKSFKINLFFLLVTCNFLPVAVYCDVHTATSCESSAVQVAISSASDGDTVIVPAGTCTWTSGISITDKRITLKGAGIGQTVISDQTGDVAVTINGPGKPFRITGFTFDGTNDPANGRCIVINDGNYAGFRIDHCRFHNEVMGITTKSGGAPIKNINLDGVVDHCTYYTRQVGTGQHSFFGTYGDGSNWKKPLVMGTSNALYIENCYIEYDESMTISDRPIMAARGGMRVVFRHNTAKRGCFEIYNASNFAKRGFNYFDAYDNLFLDDAYSLFVFDSGTGNIFNNTVLYGGNIPLRQYRIAYGTCDGTKCIDGNEALDTGTHTGSNNSALTMTCSVKTWTADQWAGYALWNITDNSMGRITSNTANTITVDAMVEGYNIADSGTATSASSTQLIDANASWGWNTYEPMYYAYNVTDGSYGRITKTAPTKADVTLQGGTDNTWQIGDAFQITLCKPTANVEKDWDTGDSFKISNGYPCLDQPGRSQDADADNIHPQAHTPVYAWNNTLDGAPLNATGNSTFIKANRDYYNAQRPGYTPFTYPHPLIALWDGVVDTSSPTATGEVRDGTSTDISTTFSTTTLSANWDASSDAQSGIVGYRYAIGTTAEGTNVTGGWIDNGTTGVTKTGLILTAGTTYYFSVKAVNGSGLISAATDSDGQCVTGDVTPPSVPGMVRDGDGATDISSTTSRTKLSANWTAATDTESGISGYNYAIGTTAGGTNISNWATLGNVLTITKTSLTLAAGTTYYFSVKAVNGAGLTGSAANSNGQVVLSTATQDTTPPSAPVAVNDGPGADIDSTFSINTLQANWTTATDSESGIANYQYAIGTRPAGTDVASWATIGNVLTVTKTGLSLTIGTTYYFSVRAVNGVALQGSSTNSDGQYVAQMDTTDTTPPSNIAQVRDGAGADVAYTNSTTALSANWDTATDQQSGVAKYWYAIGTAPGGTDVADWTDNGPDTNVTETGLTLAAGATYYFSVKAENGVGLESLNATDSDGQCVINEVPQVPVISNVQAAGITADSATITWDTDMPATSQVEYGLTAVYGSQTTEDSSLVTAHSVAITGLTAGQAYHYRVISKDSDGNQSTSPDHTFTTLSTPDEVTDIKTYPNPCDFKNGQVIKFRVGAGSETVEVKIYTLSGKLVKKLSGTSGTIDWDGTNEDNEKVSRGVYIYRIIEFDGDRTEGKIGIIK